MSRPLGEASVVCCVMVPLVTLFLLAVGLCQKFLPYFLRCTVVLLSAKFSRCFFSPLFEGRRRKITRKNHDWSKTSSCLRVVKKISTRSGTTAQRPSEVKFSIGARAGSLSTASLVFLLPPSSQGKIQNSNFAMGLPLLSETSTVVVHHYYCDHTNHTIQTTKTK